MEVQLGSTSPLRLAGLGGGPGPCMGAGLALGSESPSRDVQQAHLPVRRHAPGQPPSYVQQGAAGWALDGSSVPSASRLTRPRPGTQNCPPTWKLHSPTLSSEAESPPHPAPPAPPRGTHPRKGAGTGHMCLSHGLSSAPGKQSITLDALLSSWL